MRQVSPRIKTFEDIKEAIGKVTYTNISPTMKAKLIGYDGDKSWFEILPHEEHTQYNSCAGQTFYVPTYMAICFNYQEE
jgi:hypothetical protein